MRGCVRQPHLESTKKLICFHLLTLVARVPTTVGKAESVVVSQVNRRKLRYLGSVWQKDDFGNLRRVVSLRPFNGRGSELQLSCQICSFSSDYFSSTSVHTQTQWRTCLMIDSIREKQELHRFRSRRSLYFFTGIKSFLDQNSRCRAGSFFESVIDTMFIFVCSFCGRNE